MFTQHGQPKEYAASDRMKSDMEALVKLAITQQEKSSADLELSILEEYLKCNFPDVNENYSVSDNVMMTLEDMDIALSMNISIAKQLKADRDFLIDWVDNALDYMATDYSGRYESLEIEGHDLIESIKK